MAHTNKIGKEHSHQATSMQSLREEDGFEDKQRTDGVILTLECPRVPYSVVPHRSLHTVAAIVWLGGALE